MTKKIHLKANYSPNRVDLQLPGDINKVNRVLAEKQVVTVLKKKHSRKNMLKTKVEVPQIQNSDLEAKQYGIRLDGSNVSTLDFENQEN